MRGRGVSTSNPQICKLEIYAVVVVLYGNLPFIYFPVFPHKMCSCKTEVQDKLQHNEM